MMNERELIMSDVPWAVAWYGDRPCIWLTLNVTPLSARVGPHEDFYAVNQRKTVNALYLTSQLTAAESLLAHQRDQLGRVESLQRLVANAVDNGLVITYAAGRVFFEKRFDVEKANGRLRYDGAGRIANQPTNAR